MELFVDDAGFVRAPAPLVYRRLTDVGSWPTWWRGTRVRPLPVTAAGEEPWRLDLDASRLVRIRVEACYHGWRLDTGVLMRLHGDVEGDAEFWLEASSGGTVVHHLFAGRTSLSRPRSVHDGYRRAIRRGLWGLKDTLQLEARSMSGLVP